MEAYSQTKDLFLSNLNKIKSDLFELDVIFSQKM